ncbi:MAG: hypothetical protein MZV64_11260 [Ignavibacteriales bacterium]|nr:hypothetical protein [Ignavibacteriales bacterium]
MGGRGPGNGHEDNKKRGPKQNPGAKTGRCLGPAAIYRRQYAPGGQGAREPQGHLRGNHERPLSDRGHRPPEEPAAGQRRPDRGRADASAETPRADAEDHRRPVGPGARPHRPGRAAPAQTGCVVRDPEAKMTSGKSRRPASRRRKAAANPEAALVKAAAGRRDAKYVLRLYVAGMTPRSSAAIRAITEICEEHLKGRYLLDIIDIYRQPTLARGEQIIAAPTLIKKLPLPLRRMIGDMADTKRILVGLDLQIQEMIKASSSRAKPVRRRSVPRVKPRMKEAGELEEPAATPGRGRGHAPGHPGRRGRRRHRLRQQGRKDLLAQRVREYLPADGRNDVRGRLWPSHRKGPSSSPTIVSLKWSNRHWSKSREDPWRNSSAATAAGG